MLKSDWKIASIWVRSDKGWFQIPGWTNGLWCLDWRAYQDEEIGDVAHVFAVTHAPTGFSACSVEGSLIEAQEFTNVLSGAADWDFTEASEAPARAQAFKDAKAAFALDCPTVDILRGNAGRFPNTGTSGLDEPDRTAA